MVRYRTRRPQKTRCFPLNQKSNYNYAWPQCINCIRPTSKNLKLTSLPLVILTKSNYKIKSQIRKKSNHTSDLCSTFHLELKAPAGFAFQYRKTHALIGVTTTGIQGDLYRWLPFTWTNQPIPTSNQHLYTYNYVTYN